MNELEYVPLAVEHAEALEELGEGALVGLGVVALAVLFPDVANDEGAGGEGGDARGHHGHGGNGAAIALGVIGDNDEDDLDADLEDEDLEEDLSLSAQEELRIPKPDAIAQWWSEHQARFNAKARYIAGRPADQTPFHDY